MKDAFTSQQLAKMRDEYGKISTIDPSGPEYKQLIAMLDKMHIDNLKSLAGAKIKFVSGLAQNRVNRASAKKQPQGADFAAQRRKERLASNGRMDEEVDSIDEQHSVLYKMKKSEPKIAVAHYKSKDDADKFLASVKEKGGNGVVRVGKIGLDLTPRDKKESITEKSAYEIYHKDYSSAVQTAIKQAEKRGYEVDMDDWHDKVATGPKKPSSGKTNSFSVKLKKDGKESKKALHLQVYNMDNQKYELNMYIEEVQLDESHGEVVWKKGNQSIEKLDDGQFSVYMADGKKKMFPSLDAAKKYVNEASSPAQQAAIAIAMKKDGKKPKDMEESDAYDKNVKPSDKPHDKEAAAKRAKLAALAARKKMAEGLMDKIKAMKRGMQAKDKADAHWDKAGDPKNPEAKKDLKKAVRYTNLLNKEGTGPDLNPVAKHVTKGELKKSGISKWLAVSEEEKIPEFKSGGPELAKKFNKSFKALGVDAKVKIKTVDNVSVNEEEITEAKKKSWKDMRKKTKNEEVPNKATVKKGDDLSGKREPIEINPELKEPAK